jgi:hypothetical protein
MNPWWYRTRYPLRGPRGESLRAALALGPLDRAGDEVPIGGDDLADLARSARGGARFLGVYGADGALAAMRAHGLVARLHAMGFTRVGVELDLDDPYEHTLRVYDREPARRLGEITAARRHVQRLRPVELPPGSEVIEIGWLAMENPDAHLSAALPGQERPGLGLLRAVIDMALAAAATLRLAGITAVPSHYHLASTYHPWFRPLDPRDEGVFLGLRRATASLSRRDASWAIARGGVTLDGAPWRWAPPTMCAPVDAAVRAWVTSAAYASAAVEASSLAFALAPRRAGAAEPDPERR